MSLWLLLWSWLTGSGEESGTGENPERGPMVDPSG